MTDTPGPQTSPRSQTPRSIRQAGPTELEIEWADGHSSVYPVVDLRRACRCASCVDEWTGAQILRPEDVAADVRPVHVRPVGRYAIAIEWSDGHSSGIYSYAHLRSLCPCAECRGSAPPQPPR